MKTRKQKVTELSRIGFSDKLMSTMNESQINTLYKKLVSEQASDATKGVLNVKKGSPQETQAKQKGQTYVAYEGEMKEGKKKSKKKNPWAICTSSLADEFGTSERSDWTKSQMKKYERCVKGVKKTVAEGKNPYEFILEQQMLDIVDKHLSPKITKRDLIESVMSKLMSEGPDPLTKPKPGVKPDTDTDYDPFIDPDPSDDPEASSPEPRTKPKPGVKPDTDTDYDPFIDPDPSDDPEARKVDLNWFMSKVKRMGLLKNKKR